MYLGFHEEGDRCSQKDCNGVLEYPEVENCSCHITPPCSACTNQQLVCSECGWEDEAEPYTYVQVAPGLAMQEYKPRPLDNTKVDYRIKMHTHFTQKCVGVYPEGMSMADVQKVVDGTFGGRFLKFGGGKFEFVAYTD